MSYFTLVIITQSFTPRSKYLNFPLLEIYFCFKSSLVKFYDSRIVLQLHPRTINSPEGIRQSLEPVDADPYEAVDAGRAEGDVRGDPELAGDNTCLPALILEMSRTHLVYF